MGSEASKLSHNAETRQPVTTGITRICVVGINYHGETGRSKRLASKIAEKFSSKYEVWCYIDGPIQVGSFMATKPSDGETTVDASKSLPPYVWMETDTEKGKTIMSNEEFKKWALENTELFADSEVKALSEGPAWSYNDFLAFACCAQANAKVEAMKAQAQEKIDETKAKVEGATGTSSETTTNTTA